MNTKITILNGLSACGTERFAFEEEYRYHLSEDHRKHDKYTCQSIELQQIGVMGEIGFVSLPQKHQKCLKRPICIYARNHR